MPEDKARSPLVYIPSRWRLVPFFTHLTCFALVSFALVFWSGHSIFIDWLLVPIGIHMALISIALVYRMVRRFPSIIVREDGIVDNASLLYRGVGLLRWQDIAGVAARDFTTGLYGLWHRRFLVIVPVNGLAYESQLPQGIRLQRMLLRLIVQSPKAYICIPQFMLPEAADLVRLDAGTVYHRWQPVRDKAVWFE